MIRLAIRMLLGDTTRYLGVVLGVFFSSFLINHLLSMFAGFMTRTYAAVADIPAADIWVMDPAVEYIEEPAALPTTALQRVRSIAGVDWAVPLYSGSLRIRLTGGRFRSVQVMGLDDATLIGAPADFSADAVRTLRSADGVIVDRNGAATLLRPRTMTGPDRSDSASRPLTIGDELSINDHRAVVKGLTSVLPRFINKAVIYTTYSKAQAMAPPERNLLSFVLVGTRPGQDSAQVARAIEASTNLRARTADEFKSDTMHYYMENTDVIGQIGMMTALGVVVGFAITGLLLYMFTSENQKNYATLKALGAGNRLLVVMISAQAMICGLVGYGLGVGASCLVGHLAQRIGLPFKLTFPGMAATAAAVALVSVVAALISARKVATLEPGIVFKG